MPATALDRRVGRSNSAKRSNELIGRAAKRAGWAGTALESAARDLDGTWGADGNALSGLAEVVQDQATRVSNLAQEIESRSTVPKDLELNRSPPTSRKRNQPRQGRIIDAVTRVLGDHRQPLQAREVHARVEMLLGEPVRWPSVKATLAGNVHGAAPRFVRVARGRYAILPSRAPNHRGDDQIRLTGQGLNVSDLTDILVVGGQRFCVRGAPDDVEAKVLEAARGSILELVCLTDAESGRSVALNPAHIVAVSDMKASGRASITG